eukprot:scaffold287_cov239-Pinguiococcus_pyrenoidosus.AAC.8
MPSRSTPKVFSNTATNMDDAEPVSSLNDSILLRIPTFSSNALVLASTPSSEVELCETSLGASL